MTLPAAVLWDMDGTLVDTEPYWMEVEAGLAAEHGVAWTTQDALALVGSDLLDSGRYIVERLGSDLTPAQVVERLLDGVVERIRQHVPWRPGALELLASLREAEVPQALVTMSYRRFVDPVLEQLPAGSFDAVVTGDAVTHGKPHPAPYLAALAALGGPDPRGSVAIEDSATGARSARAAGVVVLAVPCHVEVPAELHDGLRDSLVGMAPEDLGRLALDAAR